MRSSSAASNRFANVLAQRGIAKGDRVFSLLGRCPELYIAALGTLKNGSVFSPLFSAFGPEPIKARMTIGGRQGAGHVRSFLPAQDRAVAQGTCQPRTCLFDRMLGTIRRRQRSDLAAAMAACVGLI